MNGVLLLKEAVPVKFFNAKKILKLTFAVGTIEHNGKSYDVTITGSELRVGNVIADIEHIMERATELNEAVR